MAQSGDPIVLVEIDFWDGQSTQTLRLSTQGPVTLATPAGELLPFDPRLSLPIQIGSRISAEQYGQPVRGAQNGGTIEFALGRGRLSNEISPEMWRWLQLHCLGRELRVYTVAHLGNTSD